VGLVVAALVFAIFDSQSFQNCVCANQKDANPKENSGFALFGTFCQCTGSFLEAHNAAITALASIVIAIFTGTLWSATKGMLKTSADQSEAMPISLLELSERQLVI
jgi:hypothetical protein